MPTKEIVNDFIYDPNEGNNSLHVGAYLTSLKNMSAWQNRAMTSTCVFPSRHKYSGTAKAFIYFNPKSINLIYIRDFPGHSDCSTTQIYAKADTETRRKALEAAYVDILPTTELPDWSDDKNLMNFLISLGRQ